MAKYDKNLYFEHSLWPNLTKIITVKENGKEAVTLNTVYG